MQKIRIFVFILPLLFLSNNIVYANSNYIDTISLISTKGNEAESIICGSTVNESIILTSDLDCISDGLHIFAENGLTIDLNGHSIIGPGEKSGKVGLSIKDSENIRIIGNGTIENYQSGIYVDTSMDIDISGLGFQDNEIGAFFTNAKNSQISYSVFQNNAIGTSTNTAKSITISNNSYISNDLAGITIVNSDENKISNNKVNGSVNGIFFDGQSSNNIIENNEAFQNRGVDVNNGNGLPITDNQNEFENNKCDTSVPNGLCVT